MTTILRLAASALLAALLAVPAQAKTILGEFEGTLPCADCSGLETKLTLLETKPGSGKGTYRMSENYLGKSKTPIRSTGRWETRTGTPKDPSATVYVLDPDKPQKTQYYLLRPDGSLLTLDRERNEIDAPFNLALQRKSATLANPASVNCANQGGRTEIRTNAKGDQYGVCLFGDGRACEEWALLRDKVCAAPK